MNCLLLNPKSVCIEVSGAPVQELLDEYGFEVVPVAFYNAACFSGSLHSTTVDVYQEGTYDDYFPKNSKDFKPADHLI